MAAPTKEAIAKRAVTEKVLKRDAFLYGVFVEACDQSTEDMNHDCFAAYQMAHACEIRSHKEEFYNIKLWEVSNPNDLIEGHFCPVGINKSYPLIGILGKLYDTKGFSAEQQQKDPFHNYAEDAKNLIETFKEDHPIFANALENFMLKPIIRYNGFAFDTQHKSALVQIDFTKSKEEIIAVVAKIKDEFDEDSSSVQGLYEHFGIDPELQSYSCSISECDIYKHKNPKPLSGRLADALFIYDCKQMGLTQKYAMSEINRYWINVKKLFTEQIQDKTYREYLSFVKKYIEDQHHLNFTSGAVFDLE